MTVALPLTRSLKLAYVASIFIAAVMTIVSVAGLLQWSRASLTDQERKVLESLAEGHTNREIGEKLFLSEKTVKNYVSRILDKLGLSRRAEAAAYMAKHPPRL